MTVTTSEYGSNAVPRRLPNRPLNVGIVGATGNVGTVMLKVLDERDVRIASLRAFASVRSAGVQVYCGSHSAVVEDLAAADPTGLDVALFSAGATRSLEHAQRFADAGCIVIDNSSAFRMIDGIPLVVPEVNAGALDTHRGIIANPNCSTIQLVCALKPLSDVAGLDHVHVTTFQSVSGTGKEAMQELELQARHMLSRRSEVGVAGPKAGSVESNVYSKPIAFNALPHCDSFDDEGITKEERKLMNESRKILELGDLQLGATCVRVPVFVSHSEVVHFTTKVPLSPSRARDILATAPGIRLVDNPSSNEYPTALDASGKDEVFVGRVRVDPSRENGLAMFVVADNLRKGAAANAVQIMQALLGS
jgi:aspartate-semialdehyde dehydrogenase